MMMMRLQHKRPDGEMDTYHLKPGRRYHLGRGSSCEIRILDLKLSRKHCVIEFSDNAWRIEDLCSTNGCLVDGQQIVGNAPLLVGTRIEAGTTALAVSALVAPGEDSSTSRASEFEIEPAPMPAQTEVDSGVVHAGPVTPEEPRSSRNEPSIQQEAMPDIGTHEVPAHPQNDWEPEPASAAHDRTGALQPLARDRPVDAPASPAAQTNPEISAVILPDTLIQPGPALIPRPPPKIKPVTIRVGRIDGPEAHSPLAEAEPMAPLPAPLADVPSRVEPLVDSAQPIATTPADERTFFITILGRRVGPLTRGAARELKARELKGTLSQTEIEAYPPA